MYDIYIFFFSQMKLEVCAIAIFLVAIFEICQCQEEAGSHYCGHQITEVYLESCGSKRSFIAKKPALTGRY